MNHPLPMDQFEAKRNEALDVVRATASDFEAQALGEEYIKEAELRHGRLYWLKFIEIVAPFAVAEELLGYDFYLYYENKPVVGDITQSEELQLNARLN